MGVTWNPGACYRTPHLEAFIRRHLRDAFELAEAGERPVLCMGPRAVDLWLPWLLKGEDVKPWVGHFVRPVARAEPEKELFTAV